MFGAAVLGDLVDRNLGTAAITAEEIEPIARVGIDNGDLAGLTQFTQHRPIEPTNILPA